MGSAALKLKTQEKTNTNLQNIPWRSPLRSCCSYKRVSSEADISPDCRSRFSVWGCGTGQPLETIAGLRGPLLSYLTVSASGRVIILPVLISHLCRAEGSVMIMYTRNFNSHVVQNHFNTYVFMHSFPSLSFHVSVCGLSHFINRALGIMYLLTLMPTIQHYGASGRYWAWR